MKSYLKNVSIAALAGSMFLACPSPMAAEGNKQAEQMEKKMRQVSGKIIKTKDVNIRDADFSNRVVMIETTKGGRRLIVDLGSTKNLAHGTLDQGELIAVEGPVKQIRDHRVLIADRLKLGGKGHPNQQGPREAGDRKERKRLTLLPLQRQPAPAGCLFDAICA